MKLIFKCLFCLILFCCVIVIAEEDSLYQKAVVLREKGDLAYKNNEYGKAVDTYLEAMTYLEAEELKYEIYYQLSCSYSMLGEGKKAFEYLNGLIQSRRFRFAGYRFL